MKPAFLLSIWEPLLRQAADKFGESHIATLNCHNMVGINLEQQGRITEAEQHYRVFLEGIVALEGEQNETSAAAMIMWIAYRSEVSTPILVRSASASSVISTSSSSQRMCKICVISFSVYGVVEMIRSLRPRGAPDERAS